MTAVMPYYMVRFLKENMPIVTKMIVNQLGMMIFGLVLSMATSQNDTLFLLASIFSVCFYMFLVYTVGWELGAKDKVRLDGGRIAYTPFKGVLISLAANSLNLILGILIVIGYYFLDPSCRITHEALSPVWAANLYGTASVIARFIEAMYIGIIQTYSPYNPIIFVLIVFPAVIFSGLGYFLAIKGKSISGMLGINRNKIKKDR
ncbi:MAG: hypothetical protein U0M08_07535 [Clostridia bacterium]|nr:hypothetical protein [Clostridia bacterium]